MKQTVKTKIAALTCPRCHLQKRAAQRFERFAKEDDGVVTAFAVFMILMMVLVGGIGVDLMRNEMDRTQVQAVTDRAVLAAADLDQILDPEDVVRDYFAKAGMEDYLGDVTVSEGLNYKVVSATAQATTPNMFMSVMGRDTLPLYASSTAEERIAKVEISLVVDISGSMDQGSKMTNLKTAANQFVDTVLREETEDLISVSLVPYSEHVNVGPDIFNLMNVRSYEHKGYCIELRDHRRYDQMQHFQWNSSAVNPYQYPSRWKWKQWSQNQYGRWSYKWRGQFTSVMGETIEVFREPNGNHVIDTVCPQFPYERIRPITQDAQALKDQINALRPRAGTQIFMGMRWAAALLDPTFRPATQTLALQNKVPAVFAARPAEYDDVETLKTIVLMTDGKNSSSSRISGWVYNSESERDHWRVNNFNRYLSNNVPSWDRSNWYYQKFNSSQGDSLLNSICNVVKNDGVIVWTIGFEVDNHGASVMRNCASTPSHFFRVEGIEIQSAFEAIARQINQLRLTL